MVDKKCIKNETFTRQVKISLLSCPECPVELQTKVREEFTITSKTLLGHYDKWVPKHGEHKPVGYDL